MLRSRDHDLKALKAVAGRLHSVGCVDVDVSAVGSQPFLRLPFAQGLLCLLAAPNGTHGEWTSLPVRVGGDAPRPFDLPGRSERLYWGSPPPAVARWVLMQAQDFLLRLFVTASSPVLVDAAWRDLLSLSHWFTPAQGRRFWLATDPRGLALVTREGEGHYVAGVAHRFAHDLTRENVDSVSTSSSGALLVSMRGSGEQLRLTGITEELHEELLSRLTADLR